MNKNKKRRNCKYNHILLKITIQFEIVIIFKVFASAKNLRTNVTYDNLLIQTFIVLYHLQNTR